MASSFTAEHPRAQTVLTPPPELPSYHGKNVIIAGVIDALRLDVCRQLLEKGVKVYINSNIHFKL